MYDSFGAQFKRFFGRGLISSLTGGLYYDSKSSTIIFVCHLAFWLLLIVSAIAVGYVVRSNDLTNIDIYYASAVGGVILLLRILHYWLVRRLLHEDEPTATLSQPGSSRNGAGVTSTVQSPSPGDAINAIKQMEATNTIHRDEDDALSDGEVDLTNVEQMDEDQQMELAMQLSLQQQNREGNTDVSNVSEHHVDSAAGRTGVSENEVADHHADTTTLRAAEETDDEFIWRVLRMVADMNPTRNIVNVIVLAFALTGSLFTLMRSVQPDACSPTLGTRACAYARGGYFVIFAIITMMCRQYLYSVDSSWFEFYGVCMRWGCAGRGYCILGFGYDAASMILLLFPLIFLAGVFAPLDSMTFIMLEQISYHVFGSRPAVDWVGLLVDMSLSCATCASAAGLTFWVGVYDPMSSYGWDSVISTFYHISVLIGFVTFAGYMMSKFIPSRTFLSAMFSTSAPRTLAFGVLYGAFAGALTQFALVNVVQEFNMNVWLVLSTAAIGLVFLWFMQVLMSPYPFMWYDGPFMPSPEYEQYDPDKKNKIRKTEILTLIAQRFVGYVLIPLFVYTVILRTILVDDVKQDKYTVFGGYIKMTMMHVILLPIVSMRYVRLALSDPFRAWKIVGSYALFFTFDARYIRGGVGTPVLPDGPWYGPYSSSWPLLSMLLFPYVYLKIEEAINKMKFICVYSSPFNVSWSSVAHLILHPMAVPHIGLMVIELAWSLIVSAPMYPLVASPMFLVSYPRPLRYWPRMYRTEKKDLLSGRLGDRLNVDAITGKESYNVALYRHLDSELEKVLCDDVLMGRWGTVTEGDYFFLFNESVTAMIHILQIGNGFVTYQLRGLELEGTYCHMTEVEALSSFVRNEEGFEGWHSMYLEFPCGTIEVPCTVSRKKHYNMQYANAWSMVNSSLMIRSYSNSKTAASSLFYSYEYRTRFSHYFISAILYETSKYLAELMTNSDIMSKLAMLLALESIQSQVPDVNEPSTSEPQPVFQEQANNWDSDSDGETNLSDFTQRLRALSSILRTKFRDRMEERNVAAKPAPVATKPTESVPNWAPKISILKSECFFDDFDVRLSKYNPDTVNSRVTFHKFFETFYPFAEVILSKSPAEIISVVDLQAAYVSAALTVESECSDSVKCERPSTYITPAHALTAMAYLISLAGRRAIYGAGADFDDVTTGVWMALKRDIRLDTERDSWMLRDLDKLMMMLHASICRALKCHTDSFVNEDDFQDHGMYNVVYDSIRDCYVASEVFVELYDVSLPQSDPDWETHMDDSCPMMMSLRREVTEEHSVNMSVVHQRLRYVFKINRECVRGLWAAQQHELVFLGNQDQERGSIQNMTATLRNMVSSSCDLPVGYPIYVGPFRSSVKS